MRFSPPSSLRWSATMAACRLMLRDGTDCPVSLCHRHCKLRTRTWLVCCCTGAVWGEGAAVATAAWILAVTRSGNEPNLAASTSKRTWRLRASLRWVGVSYGNRSPTGPSSERRLRRKPTPAYTTARRRRRMCDRPLLHTHKYKQRVVMSPFHASADETPTEPF